MGNNKKGSGVIFLGIAGVFGAVVVFAGGNALSSRSLGTVEGVIVQQWQAERCRTRKRSNSHIRRRTCRTVYKSKIRLPDGNHRTFDSRSWYKNKKTGDPVILDKRKGGLFGDVYYKPKKS